jgi:hypothetical protein
MKQSNVNDPNKEKYQGQNYFQPNVTLFIINK